MGFQFPCVSLGDRAGGHGCSPGQGIANARERLGFRNELRATGQVLRDQFVFMLRAGFDSFEVKKDADAKVFGAVTNRYSVFYQPTGDGRLTAFRQRMQDFVAREPALKSASR